MIPNPSVVAAVSPLRHEVAPAHEVVRGGAETTQPVHQSPAAMPQFAEQGDGFQPAESLLDQFAFALTHRIPAMAGCAGVNRTAAAPGVLRDVRRDAHLTDSSHPGPRVVQLVGRDGEAAS